jgi:hypothetical protein
MKSLYMNDYNFRFWIKQFMALALIPIQMLETAIAIIIKPIFILNDKQLEFVEYFVSQWCNAKKSKQCPDIWNIHEATMRTNYNSENIIVKYVYRKKFVSRLQGTCILSSDIWK